MNDLPNPYQKDSLATVLHMFEENLRQADDWLDGRQVEGILYRQELHLTSPQHGEVHPEAAREVDPHIRRLAQAALELAALFENHSSTPASPDAEQIS